jgi:hypothetical protein
MLEIIHNYGSQIVLLIIIGLQYKVFMTPADFQKERADLIKYIADNYVSDKTYRENHKSFQQDLHDMRVDLSDIKKILIERN